MSKAVLQFEVFWVVTQCRVVVGYHRFRGPCCLHLQGEDSCRLGYDAVLW